MSGNITTSFQWFLHARHKTALGRETGSRAEGRTHVFKYKKREEAVDALGREAEGDKG